MADFFSTIAQLAFTIAGLFFVGISVDSETRSLWFGNYISKPDGTRERDIVRDLYVMLSLWLLIQPGLIGLSGLLITDNLDLAIGSVLFSFFALLLLYLNRKTITTEEFKKIDKYHIPLAIIVYSIGLLVFGVLSALDIPASPCIDYRCNPVCISPWETILAIALIMMILNGAITAAAFLRESEVLRQGKEKDVEKKLEVEITIISTPTASTSSDIHPKHHTKHKTKGKRRG